MTDDRMALLELVEKQADGDLVREMLAFAVERIMEAEVKARTGAAGGARTPMREVQRNGYRGWSTYTSTGHPGRADRAGYPEVEEGQPLPQLPGAAPHGREGLGGARHCHSDRWRSNGSLQEACVHGVSMRSVDDLVKAMGAGGMSKSQVSRLCAE